MTAVVSPDATRAPAVAGATPRDAEIGPGEEVLNVCCVCGQYRGDVIGGECGPCASADEADAKRRWDR